MLKSESHMPYPSLVSDTMLRFLAVSLLLICLISCVESETTYFNISKGSARITLKEFAAQAKSEIIFDHSGNLSVETQPVMGRMTPEAALHIMLKETGLSYSQDTQSRAFAVSFSDNVPYGKQIPHTLDKTTQ